MWLFKIAVCLRICNIVICPPPCHPRPDHPNFCPTQSSTGTLSPTKNTATTTTTTTTTTTSTTTTKIKASTTTMTTEGETTTTATTTKSRTVTMILKKKQGIIAGTVTATVVLIVGGVLVVFFMKRRGSNCFRSKLCASSSNYREHQHEIDSSISGNNARNSGDHKYTYIDTNPEHITENNNFSYELAKPINHQSDGNETETKGAIGQYFILEKQSGYDHGTIGLDDLSKADEENYTAIFASEYDHLHGKVERQQNKLEQQNIYAHAQPIDSGDMEYDVTSSKMSKDNTDSDMYHHTGIPGGKVSENNDPYDHCSC